MIAVAFMTVAFAVALAVALAMALGVALGVALAVRICGIFGDGLHLGDSAHKMALGSLQELVLGRRCQVHPKHLSRRRAVKVLGKFRETGCSYPQSSVMSKGRATSPASPSF